MSARCSFILIIFFFFQAEDGIRDYKVTGVQTCALPILGIAVGLGTLVGGGGKPNLGLSILATAIVAAGFQPARGWLQKMANRLVYGKRATPYEVLSEFSAHVADAYAADDVLPRMARVLQEGTGAQEATVWLRSGEELRPVAAYPGSMDGRGAVPVARSELPEIA